MRAATVISWMRRVKILPRLASVAAFLCLMFAHLLWPAMVAPFPSTSVGREIIPARCAARRLRQTEPLLLQELLQHRRAAPRVVDLEHALLDRQRQRQQLGEPVADPRRVVVGVRRRESAAGRRARRAARAAARAARSASGSATAGSAAIGATSPTTRPSRLRRRASAPGSAFRPRRVTCRMPSCGMSQLDDARQRADGRELGRAARRRRATSSPRVMRQTPNGASSLRQALVISM